MAKKKRIIWLEISYPVNEDIASEQPSLQTFESDVKSKENYGTDDELVGGDFRKEKKVKEDKSLHSNIVKENKESVIEVSERV